MSTGLFTCKAIMAIMKYISENFLSLRASFCPWDRKFSILETEIFLSQGQNVFYPWVRKFSTSEMESLLIFFSGTESFPELFINNDKLEQS